MQYNEIIMCYYSREDGGYISVFKLMPGITAFGETEKESIRELSIAIEGVLEMYHEAFLENDKVNKRIKELENNE